MLRALTLDQIQTRAWELLSSAPSERESPLRVATLATVDAAGQPQARQVVLRSCDPSTGSVEVYTDARSPKVAELRREPRAALCCYDPVRQLQLRLSGPVTIHVGDERSAEVWREAGIYARRDYLGPSAPGTPLDDPSQADPRPEQAGDPGANDADAGVSGEASGENLAILRLTVERLDWLVLDRAGHRRAELRRTGAGWSARWLLP